MNERQWVVQVAGCVLDSQTVMLEPCSLIIENGRIAEIQKGYHNPSLLAAPVFRRHNHIAMPGLVNSHGHAAMTLLRGAGDDMPLMDWLNTRIIPLEDKLTGDAIYYGTLLASWEMLRSGTTCFTDMYFQMNDAARAVAESGIRGVLSWGMIGLSEDAAINGIRNSRQFIKDWRGQADGRITVTLGPHAPYTCPPDYLRQISELSAELDVPIQIHLCETAIEVSNSYDYFHASPIEHVRNCGLLDRPVLAAHCVHITEADMDIMAEHDVRVAHNPQSNLKLASGIAPVIQMQQKGLTVGLGTDGAASNNNLDMFEELRLCATLHKGISGDATVIPAAMAFDMATTGSAACCFLGNNHGTLHVGAPADIAFVTLDSPHMHPQFDVISNLVYAVGADDVTDVMVGGRLVLAKGEPCFIDVERLLFEVRKIEEHLKHV